METFVVRIWVPAAGEPAAAKAALESLRGIVEHPVSGRVGRFQDVGELVGLLMQADGSRMRHDPRDERFSPMPSVR